MIFVEQFEKRFNGREGVPTLSFSNWLIATLPSMLLFIWSMLLLLLLLLMIMVHYDDDDDSNAYCYHYHYHYHYHQLFS